MTPAQPESFMVRSLERKVAKNKDPFLIGVLFTAEATINACLWHRGVTEANPLPAPGDVLTGFWERKEFKGEPQLDLKDLVAHTPASAVTDFSPFVKTSKVTREEWTKFYYQNIEPLIEDEPIKRLLQLAVLEGTRFWRAPAAARNHHAFIGGLAEHTHTILKMFYALVGADHPHIDKCRKGLVIAGIILHDWGKIFEYDEVAPGVFEYSDFGNLMGHLAGGPIVLQQLIDKHGVQMERGLWLNFMHVLLAHHGEIEHGSPIMPATLEAYIVHNLDNFDGRMMMYDSNVGHYFRALQTRVLPSYVPPLPPANG